MALLAWDDRYAIGVQQIDDQHQRLFSLINDFYSGLRENQPKQALAELLGGMLEYTRYHFATEQSLMERHGYPAAAKHTAQHQEFVGKASDYAARFAEGKMLLSVEVTNYLRDWIVNHILATDRDFGAFLRGRGVS